MPLTLAEANRVIDAALAKARELETAICVSVCDADGHLVAHQRMDGVFAEAPLSSIGKAIGAATAWEANHTKFGSVAHHTSTDAVIGEGAPVIEGPGGLPIIRSGKIEGGIGISGAPDDEQIVECARAGTKALEMETSSMPQRG